MLKCPEDESTIVTSVYTPQGDETEGIETSRRGDIVKSRTLLYIHPYLKLDSEDTVINCYIPKKHSPGITCVVGVSRDKDNPIQVNINSFEISQPHPHITISSMSRKVPYVNNNHNRTLNDVPQCSIEKVVDQDKNNSSFEPISATHDVLSATRTEIEDIFSAGNNELAFVMNCSCIRVGSYSIVHDGDGWASDNFKVKICEKGIVFCMDHYGTPSMKIQLVIPQNMIMGLHISFSIRDPSFIVLQVGNKIAKWIKDKLGMDGTAARFDPFHGAPTETKIIFVTDIFPESNLLILRKIHGRNLTEFDHQQAMNFRKNIQLELDSDKCDQEDGIKLSSSTNAIASNNIVSSPISTKTITNRPPFRPSPGITKTIPGKPGLRPRPSAIPRINNNGQNPIPRLSTTPTATPTLIHKPAHVYNSMQGSKTVIKWPPGQGGMTLLQRDIYTLTPEQFLNDEIIDFWLLYVLKKLLSEEDRERTHLFSIHFYSRLTQVPKKRNCPAFEVDKKLSAAEKRHRRVKKWTKNVDIFKKDFVIIPIIDNCHWYVAIICFPGLNGPHWMSDDTPIPDWSNFVKINGRPTYQPPPGMPKIETTKSRRRKVKPTTIINENLNKGVPSPATPVSKDLVNGSVNNSKVEVKERSSSLGITVTKNPTSQTGETHNNKKMESCTTINIGRDGMEERDEADEDPDENSLFEDYFSSDSEVSPSSKCSSPTPGPTEDVKPQSMEGSSDVNKDSVSIKIECDVKEEPMDIDEPEDAVPTECRTDFRIKQPCIILFDSLSGFPRSRVFNTLRDYLQEEYKEKKGEVRSFSKVDVPGFMPNVPQQKNLCDCGIYVLQYVEHFFSNPFPTFCLPITDLKKWFPELKSKRKEIYDTIYDLVKAEEKSEELLKLMPRFEIPAVTSITTASSTSTTVSTVSTTKTVSTTSTISTACTSTTVCTSTTTASSTGSTPSTSTSKLSINANLKC